jgi:alanyl-tRNA synthetase
VLRIVKIEDTDVEACCGTHCDRSSEVGWVRILKSAKIQDGIVRLYFVAGKKTMEKLNYDTGILNELCRLWSIDKSQLVETGERFFKEYKKLSGDLGEKVNMVLNLQMRYVLDSQHE